MNNGQYHNDEKKYSMLIEQLYKEYSEGIHLPPEYASFFENSLMNVLIRLARYKFVAKMVKKDDEVLEVGCGSGVGTIFLGQHCKNIVGLDVKQHEVSEAQSINKRENVKFIVEDLFDLDEENKYDVIVSMDVLEHLTPEQGDKFVEKISKLLKPNGFFACGVPSIYSYEYQGELSQASHINCPDRDELEQNLLKYFGRTFPFSMNDEVVHTGFQKMAWYYIILANNPIKD